MAGMIRTLASRWVRVDRGALLLAVAALHGAVNGEAARACLARDERRRPRARTGLARLGGCVRRPGR